jgi:cell division protein FtsQ
LLFAAGGAYLVARETSVFAVETIEVEGAPPSLATEIRTALAPMVGTSLVGFSSAAADRHLAGLPAVAEAHYDRDFPHTLRVSVRVEEPVAILRQGAAAWTVSRSGRVLGELARGSYPPLPRIWLPAAAEVTVGVPVGTSIARPLLIASVVRSEHFRARVMVVREDAQGRLSLDLASGRELRLGEAEDLPLKLAVAEAVLPKAEDAAYVDVSVPSRAVAGYATTGAGAASSSATSPTGTATDSQFSG